MKKLQTLLYVTILSFFTITSPESPLNISDELIEKFPDLIWLKELYLGAEIVSKMNPEEFDKTVLLCNQCKSQFYCSHLGGLLCSQKDRKNLDILKELMTIGDGSKIIEFMLPLCNELKAECVKCRSFKGWHRNPENTP